MDVTLSWSEMPWLRLGAYLFLSTFVLGNIATWLRTRRGWHDGYTRKLNHFGHMAISTPLLAFLPPAQLLPAVVVGAIAVVLIYGVAAISKRPWVHGIVAGSLRDRDAPRSRFFFFLPLITGNIALLVAVLAFPLDAVRVAFFTVAFADGFAEPIGIRFGQSTIYRVPDLLWSGSNTKSIAGSSAVFVWALLIAATMLWLTGADIATIAIVAVAYAAIVATIEALSPRGLDNMLLLAACPPILMALMEVAT